jgi:hypothetical protein
VDAILVYVARINIDIQTKLSTRRRTMPSEAIRTKVALEIPRACFMKIKIPIGVVEIEISIE